MHIGRNWGSPLTQKDEPELVTSGPYHLVRHPIYSGILVAGAQCPSSWGGVSAMVELQRNGQDVLVSARWEWTAEITTDPSPTAEATRLTDPARTSPTANTPGTDVTKPSRVITNPLASSSTPTPCSQVVLGSAPIIRKRPAAS